MHILPSVIQCCVTRMKVIPILCKAFVLWTMVYFTHIPPKLYYIHNIKMQMQMKLRTDNHNWILSAFQMKFHTHTLDHHQPTIEYILKHRANELSSDRICGILFQYNECSANKNLIDFHIETYREPVLQVCWKIGSNKSSMHWNVHIFTWIGSKDVSIRWRIHELQLIFNDSTLKWFSLWSTICCRQQFELLGFCLLS